MTPTGRDHGPRRTIAPPQRAPGGTRTGDLLFRSQCPESEKARVLGSGSVNMGMGSPGRPKQTPVLTDAERETLQRWERRPKGTQSLAVRSKIVLSAATGVTDAVIAQDLGVNAATVRKWRTRFVARRLDGLVDEPRPGAPRTVTDEHVEAVIVKTLDETPVDATHWSTRSMAKATGMTQSTVSRMWRAFGLKPHLTETFKLSNDPLLIARVPTRRGGVVGAAAVGVEDGGHGGGLPVAPRSGCCGCRGVRRLRAG